VPKNKKIKYKFEPYARLLSILGDQLITDRKIALTELIKNSYDADATEVTIKYDSGSQSNSTKNSGEEAIEIIDNGLGMGLNDLKEVWLRPATPNKLDKKINRDNVTKLGRTIQGEKGIGRFAIHKIGRKVSVYTRKDEGSEFCLEVSFEGLDDDEPTLFTDEGSKKHKLLSEIEPTITEFQNGELIKSSGTVIRITDLREKWAKDDFRSVFESIEKLIPAEDPKAEELKQEIISDFNVKMIWEGELITKESQYSLKEILMDSDYEMYGTIDNEGKLQFIYNSKNPMRAFSKIIRIFDNKILAKENYDLQALNKKKKGYLSNKSKLSVGEFKFSLFANDLKKPDYSKLNRKQLQAFKKHFIYVLRDGVRVYPFGEKGYDWLELDKLRSVQKAGDYPSYSDIVGFVYISQEHNKDLKDTSSRQGLMNSGGIFDEFAAVVLSIVQIFHAEIKIDKIHKELKSTQNTNAPYQSISDAITEFTESLEERTDLKIIESANKLKKSIEEFQKNTILKLRTVEDLAGLGMAVEKSSHDTFMLLSRLNNIINNSLLKIKSDRMDFSETETMLKEVQEIIKIVYEQLQIIQPLFKFQRREIKEVSLLQSIKKILKYFDSEIQNKIKIEITADDDIMLRTNLGLVLQFLINIVDNAIYWVNLKGSKNKRIIFKIDSLEKKLTIADTGPGVKKGIELFIFSEFFSMKAQGRGLGLYIVKEILDRINATIYVATKESERLTDGANFVIEFQQVIDVSKRNFNVKPETKILNGG